MDFLEVVAEGFGLPALEAMAAATPLISTTAGALPEVVSPECALLIPPRSAAAIVAAALQLDAQPAARARMGEAGRARALSLFSWARAAEVVEAQYDEAIRRRKEEDSQG